MPKCALASCDDNNDRDLISVLPEMIAKAAARDFTAPLSSINFSAEAWKCKSVSSGILSSDL